MWSFIAQYWNKVCVLLAGVTQHVRFHPFRAFCGGPCSRKAPYLGVYPRGTGLSPPHTPSCRKFHCLKLDSSDGVTQHVKFHPFRAFCGGPCSRQAQYLGVYPRGTGLSPPHTPSCRKFHCLKLYSWEHEMCDLLWVARITWSTAW
jgi:hypothetical protein